MHDKGILPMELSYRELLPVDIAEDYLLDWNLGGLSRFLAPATPDTRDHFSVDLFHTSSGGERRVYVAHTWTGVLSGTLQSPQPQPIRGRKREELQRKVERLLESAGTDNWDGEGALPLSTDTVTIAKALIGKLPDLATYPSEPEVSATPHGEVDIDWSVDDGSMVTVSVCPDGNIAFSGLFPIAQVSGRAEWTGELPRLVSCCLETLWK